MMRLAAEPYEFAFEPRATALVIIDMQRDFLEPGGFGAALGNDGRACAPPSRRPRACSTPAARPACIVIHTREGHRPDLTDLPPAKQRRGQLATRHRRSRADGAHPGARRAGPRHHPRTGPGARRAGRRQARQGRVLRHRPGGDAARPRHRPAARLRRHHRGLRQHHGARGQRPRLRLPGAGGLHRLVLPRVPGDGPGDDQGAGRHFRLGGAVGGAAGDALDEPRHAYHGTHEAAGIDEPSARWRPTPDHLVGARRLERLLRPVHQRRAERHRADRAVPRRGEAARRHRVRPHPARARHRAADRQPVLRLPGLAAWRRRRAATTSPPCPTGRACRTCSSSSSWSCCRST